MDKPEVLWVVVWYDCCEDPDCDDEHAYAVRINNAMLNKLFIDFKYIRFPYKGKTEEWKRSYWTGTAVPLDTPTRKLADYYDDGETVADIPDITKHVIDNEIRKVENEIARNRRRLDELKQYPKEV